MKKEKEKLQKEGALKKHIWSANNYPLEKRLAHYLRTRPEPLDSRLAEYTATALRAEDMLRKHAPMYSKHKSMMEAMKKSKLVEASFQE